MACNCSGCKRSKQISTLRQLQPDTVHKRAPSKYATKSNKILMDRFLASQKNLKLYIGWYKRSHEDRLKNPPRSNASWSAWFHEPIGRTHYCARKYREARAECKKRGLL